MVKQIWLFVRQWRWPWFRSSPKIAVVITHDPPERGPAKDRKQAKEHAEAVSRTGRFYFREDILDQLDEYFVYIRRMRKHDPQAYAIYSKIGAAIVSEKADLMTDALPPSWRAGDRPAFAAVTLLAIPENEGDWIHYKFAYFQKQTKPAAWVQRTNGGSVYEVTLFYSVMNKPVMTAPLKFHIHIDPVCNITLLHWHTNAGKWLHGKRRHDKFYVPNSCWKLPQGLLDLCADKPEDREPYSLARYVFTMIATTHESVASDIRISASKDRETAVFGIDLQRTPYFFKDRDATVNINGNKKRIFHVVRPHERHHASGEVSIVRNHFRGLREFTWNGYKVLITLPGKHHIDLLRFDAGSYDVDKKETTERMLTATQLGERLKHYVEK